MGGMEGEGKGRVGGEARAVVARERRVWRSVLSRVRRRVRARMRVRRRFGSEMERSAAVVRRGAEAAAARLVGMRRAMENERAAALRRREAVTMPARAAAYEAVNEMMVVARERVAMRGVAVVGEGGGLADRRGGGGFVTAEVVGRMEIKAAVATRAVEAEILVSMVSATVERVGGREATERRAAFLERFLRGAWERR